MRLVLRHCRLEFFSISSSWQCEVDQSRKEDAIYLDSPHYSKTLELDNILAHLLSVSVRNLDPACTFFQFSCDPLYEDKADPSGDQISVEAVLLCDIKIGQGWCCYEHCLGTIACLLINWRPHKINVWAQCLR